MLAPLPAETVKPALVYHSQVAPVPRLPPTTLTSVVARTDIIRTNGDACRIGRLNLNCNRIIHCIAVVTVALGSYIVGRRNSRTNRNAGSTACRIQSQHQYTTPRWPRAKAAANHTKQVLSPGQILSVPMVMPRRIGRLDLHRNCISSCGAVVTVALGSYIVGRRNGRTNRNTGSAACRGAKPASLYHSQVAPVPKLPPTTLTSVVARTDIIRTNGDA